MRGSSRSYNYQPLCGACTEKNPTSYGIVFLQTSKNMAYYSLKPLILGQRLYLRELNSKLFPPSISHLSLIHGLLTLGEICYQKLTQCLLSYSLIDDVQSSVTDLRSGTSTKIDIEQLFLTIIFKI